MQSKTSEQKIVEWAEGLEQSDPDWWGTALANTMRREKCSNFEARERIINRAIASCEPSKYGIPASIQWRGVESDRDRECRRCKILKTGGKLRYLGHHCFGTTKVAKCWYVEDIEICDVVEVPEYLHCWRCEVCANEYTDDWFLG